MRRWMLGAATALLVAAPAALARADAGLAGLWSGPAIQSDGKSYEIQLRIPRGGDARIHYKGLDCGGTLTPLAREGDTFRYRETITYGQDTCASGGVVNLTPDDAGMALEYAWAGKGAPATAAHLEGLRFVVAPETCGECEAAQLQDALGCDARAGDKEKTDGRACFDVANKQAEACRAKLRCPAK